jgi:prophage regulatory protein
MPSSQTTSHAVGRPSIQSLRDRPRRAQLVADDSDSAGRLVHAASSLQGERLLRLRDVLTIVGLSRAHVYNLVKQELFPRPIALGSNCARWVQSEVQAWVSNSIQTARSEPGPRSFRKAHAPRRC